MTFFWLFRVTKPPYKRLEPQSYRCWRKTQTTTPQTDNIFSSHLGLQKCAERLKKRKRRKPQLQGDPATEDLGAKELDEALELLSDEEGGRTKVDTPSA